MNLPPYYAPHCLLIGVLLIMFVLLIRFLMFFLQYMLNENFSPGFRKLWQDARDALDEGRGACVGTVEKTKIKLDRLYGNHQYLILAAEESEDGEPYVLPSGVTPPCTGRLFLNRCCVIN